MLYSKRWSRREGVYYTLRPRSQELSLRLQSRRRRPCAIIYSLFSSCKAADIETRTWLEDILNRLPGHEGDLADLLPGNWRH